MPLDDHDVRDAAVILIHHVHDHYRRGRVIDLDDDRLAALIERARLLVHVHDRAVAVDRPTDDRVGAVDRRRAHHDRLHAAHDTARTDFGRAIAQRALDLCHAELGGCPDERDADDAAAT